MEDGEHYHLQTELMSHMPKNILPPSAEGSANIMACEFGR